jgi:hypothetical protein
MAPMILTADQWQAVRDGRPVRIPSPEVGGDCVVLRADIFERVASILDDGLTSEDVARLIDQNMLEYDEADPLLDSYQSYRE